MFASFGGQHPKAFISAAVKMPFLVKVPMKLSTSPRHILQKQQKVAAQLAIKSTDRILIEDN